MRKTLAANILAVALCWAAGCGDDGPTAPASPSGSTSPDGAGASTVAGGGRGPEPTNFQPPGAVGVDAPAPSGP